MAFRIWQRRMGISKPRSSLGSGSAAPLKPPGLGSGKLGFQGSLKKLQTLRVSGESGLFGSFRGTGHSENTAKPELISQRQPWTMEKTVG